ncbi:hypothetical protein F5B22DRAFT_614854 [Xylaria bambusicola]|uniref:uncharacterized protein n=1 Tax=Xylaria bambusicola TaxID=326684 RepID=UPI0020072AC3|nr:uncharacterized protein F5B22DRAFT_614854 [Xylaria bambusicola]KAI0512684.1 hypothetical protein F5B22DRAFT_614854 [Xylaria bambusicola]
MQRLIPRSVFSKRQVITRLWDCQTRSLHQRRRGRFRGQPPQPKFPPFDSPDLVIELDGENTKGVRIFDPKLDGEPAPKSRSAKRDRDLQPIKERLANFEAEYEQNESNFRSICDDVFNPLHINDFDFLAIALLDSANVRKMATHEPTSYANTLNSVLDQNGVPHTMRDNTFNTIQYMWARLRLRNEKHALSVGTRRPMTFKGNLTFPEIDRLVTMAAKIYAGRRWLSELGVELHASLLAAHDTDPASMLTLINNMVINLERNGQHIPAEFYDLGISTSLKCNAILTAQHYIKRRLKRRPLDDEFIHNILTKIKEGSIVSNAFSHHAFQLDVSSRLRTVFSLLTGYTPGEDGPTLSLRSLIVRENLRNFHLYIQCLARLGAFRTLWHEHHKIDSASHNPTPFALKASNFNKDFVKGDHVVSAILHALAENPDMASLARSPGFSNATGQFWQDCQLDMLAISRSAKVLATPGKNVSDIQPSSIYGGNWGIMSGIFQDTSIDRALPALQAFLMSKPSFS